MMGDMDVRDKFGRTALHILKGALCTVLEIPNGQSTKYVKKSPSNMKATLAVGPIRAEPTDDQKMLIQRLVDEKVKENVELRTFCEVPRKAAEKMYGKSFYDNTPLPETVEHVRLVMIPNWHLSASNFPVLAKTGMLESISVKKYQLKDDVLEVSIAVKEGEGEVCVEECVPEEELPSISSVLPSTCAEEMNTIDVAIGQQVTPWHVEAGEGGVDYTKLIRQFGCSAITPEIIKKVEELTGHKAHRFLRRGLFFSHRDVGTLLEKYEKGQNFYLYTGRGPSSESLHMGHLVPFMFTRYLQKAFGAPCVIQLTDDEKFLFSNSNLELEEARRLGFENAKDIIAMGFEKEKTFIFSDVEHINLLYPTVLEIQKKITFNQTRGAFGFGGNDNIGKISFPAVQAAPSFGHCFKRLLPNTYHDTQCLIPQAIDQDPYFRVTRDVAPRLGWPKPALIHSKFIPSLNGSKGKMSGSQINSCVYITDDPKTVKTKINKHAFSGGQDTLGKQKELGANLDVDVSYQYLTYILEDDQELHSIGEKYKKGELGTGELKAILIKELNSLFADHQGRRAKVTDEEVREFMNANRTLD